MKNMKRVLLLLLTAAFAFLMTGAYAQQESVDIGINSESSESDLLIEYKGEVYCLLHDSSLNHSILCRIADGKSEQVYSDAGIEGICSHEDGIVMVREKQTLNSYFAKTVRGDIYIEIIDPDTKKITQWDFDSSGEIGWNVFTADGKLYRRINKESGCTFERYDMPKEKSTLLETQSAKLEYPSFAVVSAETGILISKHKVMLTLFDFESQRQYETKSALSLRYDYDTQGALQAVFKDEKLYYLSADALRVYDFAEHTDSEVIALHEMNQACRRLSSFILSDKYAVFFAEDLHQIDVYDVQTGAHLAQYISEVKTDEHLLCADKLYLYNRYDAETQKQIGDAIFFSASGVGTKVECIDLEASTQTMIDLIQ